MSLQREGVTARCRQEGLRPAAPHPPALYLVRTALGDTREVRLQLGGHFLEDIKPPADGDREGEKDPSTLSCVLSTARAAPTLMATARPRCGLAHSQGCARGRHADGTPLLRDRDPAARHRGLERRRAFEKSRAAQDTTSFSWKKLQCKCLHQLHSFPGQKHTRKDRAHVLAHGCGFVGHGCVRGPPRGQDRERASPSGSPDHSAALGSCLACRGFLTTCTQKGKRRHPTAAAHRSSSSICSLLW